MSQGHFEADFADPNSPLHRPLVEIVRSQLPGAAKGVFEYGSEPYGSGNGGKYRVDVFWDGSKKRWQPIYFTIIDLLRELHK